MHMKVHTVGTYIEKTTFKIVVYLLFLLYIISGIDVPILTGHSLSDS